MNITSISARRAQPDRWTYSATKGALKTMTKFMALDLSKDGIRVNSVGPGWIWSPEVKHNLPCFVTYIIKNLTGISNEMSYQVGFKMKCITNRVKLAGVLEGFYEVEYHFSS